MVSANGSKSVSLQPSHVWRGRLSVFLLVLLLGLGVALLGVMFKFAIPPSTWISPGSTSDFPAAPHPYLIQESQVTYYMVNTGTEIQALSAKHPHVPYCFIAWNADFRYFIDPCRGTQFFLDGSYHTGPPANMGHYPVQIKDGQIWVDLTRLIPGQEVILK